MSKINIEQVRTDIANELRSRREFLQIPVEDLAWRIGIAVNTLDRFEAGKFWIGSKHLVLICIELDVDSLQIK